MNEIKSLTLLVEKNLLHNIVLKTKTNGPVAVENLPKSWNVLGSGNYAAVFYHNRFPQYAVKVYRRKSGKYKNKSEGIKDEVLVYQKLRSLQKKCFASLHYYNYEKNYIIIDRIKGITLYDCLRKGIDIPIEVIREVDSAIEDLKVLNLSPHDIHFKNILKVDSTAVIIDVSDFLNFEYCPLWEHSKKFYNFYKKIPLFPIPAFLLDLGKNIYKFFSPKISKYNSFTSVLTIF